MEWPPPAGTKSPLLTSRCAGGAGQHASVPLIYVCTSTVHTKTFSSHHSGPRTSSLSRGQRPRGRCSRTRACNCCLQTLPCSTGRSVALQGDIGSPKQLEAVFVSTADDIGVEQKNTNGDEKNPPIGSNFWYSRKSHFLSPGRVQKQVQKMSSSLSALL